MDQSFLQKHIEKAKSAIVFLWLKGFMTDLERTAIEDRIYRISGGAIKPSRSFKRKPKIRRDK